MNPQRTAMNYPVRIIGLILAVLTAWMSVMDLIMTRKIVAISGPAYRWGYYLLPFALLGWSVYLLAYWVRRLIKG